MKYISLYIVFTFSFTVCTLAGKRELSLTDFGIRPGDNRNALVAFRNALKACAEQGISTLVVPEGRYDFREDTLSGQSTGITVDGFKQLEIKGNGSQFVFHGLMSICNIIHSENIRLSGFSVDWERPFISQGEIIAATSHSIDIKIDSKLYPYYIKDNRIVFRGENWERGVCWHNLYDKNTKDILYRTLDMPLGERLFTQYPVREIGDGIIRIDAPIAFIPEAGTFITLWHGRYMKNGISIHESKNVIMENIQVYHALSNGVMGFRSENITMDNVNMTADSKKGRCFSLIADASHFNTCRGVIKVENCCHTGQGDDFINIHGMNIVISGKVDECTVDIPSSGKSASANTVKEGDEMWLINKETFQREASRTIQSVMDVYDGNRRTACRIRFNEKLPENVHAGDMLENKTWAPGVIIRRCRILKKHRARGILVSTPGKVIIEDNYFNTAGSAILIEGDNNFWFESGACNDVVIRNNVFEDCFTSEWGKGVITITPSHRPQNTDDKAYHRNIRICNNIFRHFDRTILYARSVENLQFSGNEIRQTFSYPPFGQEYGFFLDGCRKVLLERNRYDAGFPGKRLIFCNMALQDMRIGDKDIAVSANEEAGTVNARDYITGRDATPGVNAAMERCKKTGAKKLVFPKGVYEFWTDYATEKYLFISNNDGSLKRIAFDCTDMKNFEIDGQGSRFIFHGFITPFLLDNAQGVKIKNLSVDYSRTFHSEGQIRAVYGDSIDVRFSPAYPYRIENNVLIFVDDEKIVYPWNSLLEFDTQRKETAYKAVDYWCGPYVPVKELTSGDVRLYYPGIKATVGNTLVFGCSHRLVPGFFVHNSKQIDLSRIDIYHCGGMGVIAQLSEDIRIDSVRVTPAPGSGRIVSITADATHFVNCRGKVSLTDCLFENQKDDATNIHGLYAQIDSLLSPTEIIVKMVHPQQAGVDFVFAGEEMEFVESESLLTCETGRVKAVERINKEYTKVSFTRPFSGKVKKGDGIATLHTQPEVLIKNCTIRGNRARGILLGSRAKTLVEGNYFHTAGSAILLEGDCRFWYEQAGVRDLTVRNNVFDNCFYGTWGNAVIQVGSGIREDRRSVSRYNRHIVIEDNLFRVFTPEILNIYSVHDLVFRNNTIEKTTDYNSGDKNVNPFIVEYSSGIKIDY